MVILQIRIESVSFPASIHPYRSPSMPLCSLFKSLALFHLLICAPSSLFLDLVVEWQQHISDFHEKVKTDETVSQTSNPEEKVMIWNLEIWEETSSTL